MNDLVVTAAVLALATVVSAAAWAGTRVIAWVQRRHNRTEFARITKEWK